MTTVVATKDFILADVKCTFTAKTKCLTDTPYPPVDTITNTYEFCKIHVNKKSPIASDWYAASFSGDQNAGIHLSNLLSMHGLKKLFRVLTELDSGSLLSRDSEVNFVVIDSSRKLIKFDMVRGLEVKTIQGYVVIGSGSSRIQSNIAKGLPLKEAFFKAIKDDPYSSSDMYDAWNIATGRVTRFSIDEDGQHVRV